MPQPARRLSRWHLTTLALALAAATSCSPDGALDQAVESQEQAATVTYPAIDFATRPSYMANNVLGLSFDDGPDSVNTPLVLDVLKAKGVKATFFINTNNFDGPVDSNTTLKNLIRRIVNEGHQLGSHTVTHPHLNTLSTTQIDAELKGVQTTVNRSDVLGVDYPKITLMRAPFGEPYQGSGAGNANYDKVAPVVAKYHVHIGWAIDTTDYNCTGTPAQQKTCVYNNFVNAVKTVGTGSYGQVLMHSVQPQTAAAIGDIIDYAKSKGFVFKLAEDFVQARFGKSSNEIVYGTTPPPPTCNQTPFGGTARGIPGQIQFEDFDNGGNNCAYSDTTAANNGNAYRTTEQVDIQATPDTGGGFNIGWVVAGEYLEYTVNVASAGNYKLELRSSATATGKTVDVLTGTTLVADNVALPNTGSYATYATTTVNSVTLPAGTQVLRFLLNTSSMNLNWFRLSAISTCTPETDVNFCGRLGKNCGTVSGTDNCGTTRNAACGTCTAPATCGGSGTPNVCGACPAEDDAAFCGRLGKNCGVVSGTDNCGAARTVESCGSCTDPQTCGGGGTPNVCGEGCQAEDDATFCGRLGKNCGTVSGTDNCGSARSALCGTCGPGTTCSPTNVCVSPGASFFFEAETGTGANTSPMIVANDANASAGKYTWSGTASSNSAVPTTGRVKFTFTVATAATFKVWGRFLVGPATTSDDSLWVRMDTGAWTQWNDIFPRVGNAGYRWDSEHDTVNGNAVITRSLTAGSHTLEVAYRENGLKMDRFLVTSDLALTPSP